MNNVLFPVPQALMTDQGGAGPTHGKEEAAPRLLVYFNILRRHKWLIAAIVAATVVVGIVVTLLMTPNYVAVAKIEIQRESMNIVRVQGVEPENSGLDLEFYQTQYSLLQSDTVAEGVATDLRLYDSALFFRMFSSSLGESWFENDRLASDAPSRERRIQEAGKILLDNLEVEPIRLSRLVDVSFSSPDPAFSSRVANAWTRTFINTTLERRLDATSYARRFLENRLDQTRRRLNESEQQLVQYAEQQGIVNLPGTTGPAGVTSERSIIVDDLTALNTARAEALGDRVRAETALRAGGSATAQPRGSPVVEGLRLKRAEIASDYAKLLTQFEPSYPQARALRDQLDSLDRALSTETGRDLGSLATAYNAATAREQQLTTRVDNLKQRLLNQRRSGIQYNIFQRDVDTNRQLYDALLQRYKEIGVAGGVGVNNIAVVDPAKIPGRPASPRPLLNLLISIALGLALGASVALVLEHLNDAVSSPNELSDKLSVPVLGIIPNSNGIEGSLADRKSEVSEAYLAAQTSLSFTTEHGFPRTMMVTSSAPSEGKSTTAYALALSLIRTGKRAVLIDGDMRSPSVHHLLGIPNDIGLSNFLSGSDDVKSMIHRPEGEGVPVVTAGPLPPNAAELLSGKRFELFLARLLEHVDHVVVDAPPVMGLADSPLMGHQVEAVVFVVRAQATRVSAARAAIQRMEASQAHVTGTVLTRYDAKRSFYGYGYDYGHSYGYGSNRTSE